VTKSLIELVTRLQEDVPARDSVPSAAQYESAVKDAVSDFSRRTGRTKITTISVISGTATYDLPGDFVKLVRLESLTTPDRVIISGDGIIPVSATWQERWTIADGKITFYPTPVYNLSRDLEYQAGWVLDASDEYLEMGEEEAGIVLLEAASKALKLQANKASQQAWQYQVGDERISKERLATELRAQSQENHSRYLEAVGKYNGLIGTRSSYNRSDYS
jgi:hypothetical protein